MAQDLEDKTADESNEDAPEKMNLEVPEGEVIPTTVYGMMTDVVEVKA